MRKNGITPLPISSYRAVNYFKHSNEGFEGLTKILTINKVEKGIQLTQSLQIRQCRTITRRVFKCINKSS